jgi:hypothetical protein
MEAFFGGEGGRYSSYSFLTSALDWGEWSASRPDRALPRGKDPRYPLDRRLGGPRTGLEAEARRKILCPCRGSKPDRPARSPIQCRCARMKFSLSVPRHVNYQRGLMSCTKLRKMSLKENDELSTFREKHIIQATEIFIYLLT